MTKHYTSADLDQMADDLWVIFPECVSSGSHVGLLLNFVRHSFEPDYIRAKAIAIRAIVGEVEAALEARAGKVDA